MAFYFLFVLMIKCTNKTLLVYLFPGATVTKCHTLGNLQICIHCLRILEARNLTSGFSRVGSLWGCEGEWVTGLYKFLVFGEIFWRRKWQPTPVLLPGKSHGWRSQVGYSPWGGKESDTTEWLQFQFGVLWLVEASPLSLSSTSHGIHPACSPHPNFSFLKGLQSIIILDYRPTFTTSFN